MIGKWIFWGGPVWAVGAIWLVLELGGQELGYDYVNPDNAAAVHISEARHIFPRLMVAHEVSLIGAFPRRPPDATGRLEPMSVKLGTFRGDWPLGSIAWTDATTVDICPLRNLPNVPRTVAILAAETTMRTYRITTTCARTPRAPRMAPYPGTSSD